MEATAGANYRPGRHGLRSGRPGRSPCLQFASLSFCGRHPHDIHQNRLARLERDPVPAQDGIPDEGRTARARTEAPGALGQARALPAPARGGQGPAQVHPPRRSALRQRQHPHRHRAQQDPQGHGDALAADAGLRFQLRAGLGLPRAAHRVEDRGGVPRQGQGQGCGARRRVPQAVPRVRRALDRGAARGVQAPWRRGRLGALLLDHGLQGRGHHRGGIDEVRHERRALPRLQTGDVERGGEDGARRGRGGVPRLHQRHRMGEISRRFPERVRSRRDGGGHLDHDAVDAAWKPRDRVLIEDRVRPL